MSRFVRRLLAAAAPLSALIPMHALAQQAAPERMSGYIVPYVMGSDPQNLLLREPMPASLMRDWVSSADYPAEAIAARQQGLARVRVALDARGGVIDCTIVPPPADAEAVAPAPLQALACRLVRERGHFLHALDKAGKPVAAAFDMDFYFRLVAGRIESPSGPPPAPPAPPLPRTTGYVAGLRLDGEPDWQAFAPAGRPDGEVAVKMLILPARGAYPGRRFCTLTDGSGDAELDRATCAALHSATFLPVPDVRSNEAELLVKWRNGKAAVITPRRDRKTPLAIADPQALTAVKLPPGLEGKSTLYAIGFKADGTLDCRLLGTTGSDAGDIALCAKLRETVRFTPEIDLFGRKVTVRRTFRYTP